MQRLFEAFVGKSIKSSKAKPHLCYFDRENVLTMVGNAHVFRIADETKPFYISQNNEILHFSAILDTKMRRRALILADSGVLFLKTASRYHGNRSPVRFLHTRATFNTAIARIRCAQCV